LKSLSRSFLCILYREQRTENREDSYQTIFAKDYCDYGYSSSVPVQRWGRNHDWLALSKCLFIHNTTCTYRVFFQESSLTTCAPGIKAANRSKLFRALHEDEPDELLPFPVVSAYSIYMITSLFCLLIRCSRIAMRRCSERLSNGANTIKTTKIYLLLVDAFLIICI